jgi:hypothetical protein
MLDLYKSSQYIDDMYNAIRDKNSVRVVENQSLLTKYTVTPAGPVVGTPLIQGNHLTVQAIEGDHVKTKIYNLETGQLQASI